MIGGQPAKLQKSFGTRIELHIRKTLDHVLPLLLFDQIIRVVLLSDSERSNHENSTPECYQAHSGHLPSSDLIVQSFPLGLN